MTVYYVLIVACTLHNRKTAIPFVALFLEHLGVRWSNCTPTPPPSLSLKMQLINFCSSV